MPMKANGGRALYFDATHLIEVAGDTIHFYLVSQTIENGLATSSLQPIKSVPSSQTKELAQAAKALWVSSALFRKLFTEKKLADLGDAWTAYQELEMQVNEALRSEIIKNLAYLLHP